MKENIDRGLRAAEAGGNIMQGLGRISILVSIVLVLGGGWFVYNKVTNIGAAVIEGGVDAATGAIEATGETARAVREATVEAVSTATEGIDTEGLAERADGAVDGAIDWFNQKKQRLNGDTGE